MSSTSTFVEKVVAGWEVVTKFRSEYKYIIDLIAAIFKTFLALIILGFFAANFALSLQTRDEINSLTDSQELAFATIEITHELAKERGMSNVLVLSAGVEFASRIGSQRSDVDRVVSDSLGVLDRFSSSGNDKVQRLVNNILYDLAQLPTIRSRIDTLNITSSEVISFYSDLNDNLVKIAEELPPPDAGDVTKAINTYVNFAYFKDRVGLERAGIAAVTYQGFYNKGQRDDIVGYLAQQDALTLLFNVSAKDSRQQWLAGLKVEPRWLNFTSKAKEVLANTGVNVTGLAFDVYGWWDSITPAIDNLRITLELALKDDLTEETDAALANIRDLIIINSFGMGLTIIIICAYIIIIIFNASFALGKYLRIKKKVMDMTKEIQEDSNWD